jgi:hypothetical protein
MWLCPGAPEDPEDNIVMEKHGAEAFSCEEFDACYRDDGQRSSPGYGAPDDSDCKPLMIRQWSGL